LSFDSIFKSIDYSNALLLLITLILTFLLRDCVSILLVLSIIPLTKFFVGLCDSLTIFINNCPKHLITVLYIKNPILSTSAIVILAGDVVNKYLIDIRNKVNIIETINKVNSTDDMKGCRLFSPIESDYESELEKTGKRKRSRSVSRSSSLNIKRAKFISYGGDLNEMGSSSVNQKERTRPSSPIYNSEDILYENRSSLSTNNSNNIYKTNSIIQPQTSIYDNTFC